jgi:glycosyltransferase involved in cell wall biosynthesis
VTYFDPLIRMPPSVSIVMAAKNYARFLPEAVESVLAQTFSDWELLIIDDGSTDNTPDVVHPFLADPRVRYTRADRLGQPRAKNLGITLARGEFIAFLDADDAWEPEKLEKQLPLFHNRPEVGVVYCRRRLMDEAGNLMPRRQSPQPPRGRILDRMIVQNHVCFSSAMVRRIVFSHVGMFDPEWDLAIDYDLWLRVARHYEFDVVDEELVRYRTGHGNLSKKQADRVDTALSIMRRAETRRSISSEVPMTAIAEAHASTCRTMAYVLRASEPLTAARWYLRALRWPSGRLASLRGLTASILRFLSGRRAAAAPENASVNR